MPAGDGHSRHPDDVTWAQYVTIMRNPDRDGIYGTSDDISPSASPTIDARFRFSPSPMPRNVVPSLRAINVTIQYNTPRLEFRKPILLVVHFAVPVRGNMRHRSRIRHLGFTLAGDGHRHGAGHDRTGRCVNFTAKRWEPTWIVSARAEMQQDFRSAANILTKT